MSSTLKRACGAGLIASALALGGPAAATIYTLDFQEVTFTVDATNGASSFTLRIQNALDAGPDWTDATHLGALGIKDLGIDFSQPGGATAVLNTVPPGGGSTPWDGLNAELNAGACSENGSPDGAICFSGVPPLALSNDMTFLITITGGILDINDTNAQAEDYGPHLKIQFLDYECKTTGQGTTCDYNKVGSLMSLNAPPNGGGDDDEDDDDEVPEPATLALIGIGLFGLAASRRRGRKQ